MRSEYYGFEESPTFKNNLESLPPEDFITDGFGNFCAAICSICNNKTVYVNRPGDFRCSNCYDAEVNLVKVIQNALEEIQELPCKISEMTPREFEIYQCASKAIGTLQFVLKNLKDEV